MDRSPARGSIRGVISELLSLPGVVWLRAVLYGAIASVLIAVPSDLIDTPIFGRPVETRWIDYLILVVTSALIGLVFAIRPAIPGSAELAQARERDDRRAMWSGFVSFLAVGCPVCNKVVVALLGFSGALAWWAPIQPIVGLVAIGLLLYTLRKSLSTYGSAGCRIRPGARQQGVPAARSTGEGREGSR